MKLNELKHNKLKNINFEFTTNNTILKPIQKIICLCSQKLFLSLGTINKWSLYLKIDCPCLNCSKPRWIFHSLNSTNNLLQREYAQFLLLTILIESIYSYFSTICYQLPAYFIHKVNLKIISLTLPYENPRFRLHIVIKLSCLLQ